MGETYDWSGFHQVLCEYGPRLLVGINDDLREIIAMIAADTDSFWSDGLESLLLEGAAEGELRAGVLATVEQWRENVLTTLSNDFSIELDWNAVTIDAGSPLVDDLVDAATPK